MKRITAPPIVHLILVVMAYFAAAAWPLKIFGTASPLWFANAIAVAALLRHPTTTWPVFLPFLFLADAGAVRWFGDGGPALVIALLDMLEVTLAAFLIHRLGGVSASFQSLAKAARMMAVCLVVPLVIAAGGALALSDSHSASFASIWRSWYGGTGLGLLLVTPVLLIWSDARLRQDMLERLTPARAAGLAAGLALLALVVNQDFNRPALFLSFPLIMLLTWSFGLLGATTAVMTATAASLVATVNGYGRWWAWSCPTPVSSFGSKRCSCSCLPCCSPACRLPSS